MNRRHRSWWDVITDTTARWWNILRTAEYDALQVFAACGVTGVLVFFVARAT